MGQVFNPAQLGHSLQSEELGLVEAIAVWCETLQGKDTFNGGLLALCKAMCADAAAIVRLRPESGKPGRAICVDYRGRNVGAPALKRSYGAAVMGEYLALAKPATIWQSTTMDDDQDPALTRFQNQRGLKDLTVIPLAQTARGTDLLELHFAAPLDPQAQALLNCFVGTIVRAWERRQPGLFLDSLLESACIHTKLRADTPILDLENRCKLSRAEYRVCVLLTRGLSKTALLDELSISKSTLRTHLRNIYSKTETANQAELMFQLLAPRPGGAANHQSLAM